MVTDEHSLSDVRIWYRDIPVGVGFVVDERHIMTCAHVVADALGDRARAKGKCPSEDELIEVDFLAIPAGRNRTRVGTTVRSWKPIGAESPADIALLRLANNGIIPPNARPVEACNRLYYEDTFRAFGVARNMPDGRIVFGMYTGKLADGRLQVNANTEDAAVRPGCSGAAAWNVRRGGIMGMVVQQQDQHAARLISVADLLMVFPELRYRRTNHVPVGDGHEQDSEGNALCGIDDHRTDDIGQHGKHTNQQRTRRQINTQRMTNTFFSVPNYADAVRLDERTSALAAIARDYFFVSVEGIMGSGKTYLVSDFIRDPKLNLGWNEVVWYDLSHGETIDLFLLALPTLEVPPGFSQKAKVQALVTFLFENNILLVLDNCHLADSDSMQTIVDVACGVIGSCRIICISQQRVTGVDFSRHVARYVPEMLSEDQVARLVDRRLRGSLLSSQYARLVEVTDGLPFAIGLFCILVSEFGYTADSLLAGVTMAHERITAWCERATRRLEAGNRDFFFALGAADGPIDSEVVEETARALRIDDYRACFEQIVGWYLLRRSTSTSWVMHRILADYCKSKLDNRTLKMVVASMARLYRRRGAAAENGRSKALNWALACRYFVAAGQLGRAEALVNRLAPVAKRAGCFSVLRNVLTYLSDARKPKPLSNWLAYHYAHSLFVTGNICDCETFLQNIIAVQPMSDVSLRLSCQRLLVDTLLAQGRLGESVALLPVADQLAGRTEITRVSVRQYLGTKFQVMLATNRLSEAESVLNATLQMPVLRGNHVSTGVVYMHLSQLAYAREDSDRVLLFASRAADDFKAAGDQRGMLWSEAQIGLAEIVTGATAEGLKRVVASARKLSQFELTPHGFDSILCAALSVCDDEEEREFLEGELIKGRD